MLPFIIPSNVNICPIDQYPFSKDDDMKMFFRYILAPQSALVNCILLSFIQMQLYTHINQYPFFKWWWHENVLQVHLCMSIAYGGSLGHMMFLNNIAHSWSEHARRRFLSLLDANHNFSGLCWLVISFFLCPPANLNIASLPFQVLNALPLAAPLLKECREVSMSFLSRISQTQSTFFFVR